MEFRDPLYNRLDHILSGTAGKDYTLAFRNRLGGYQYIHGRHPAGDAYYIKFILDEIERFHFVLNEAQWPGVTFHNPNKNQYWFYHFDSESKRLKLDTEEHHP